MKSEEREPLGQEALKRKRPLLEDEEEIRGIWRWWDCPRVLCFYRS